MKADVASFDRGVLSVSWGACFLLPVTSLFVLLFSMFTCSDRVQVWKNLVYVRGFHLVWFNVLVKETFGIYFTAQTRR